MVQCVRHSVLPRLQADAGLPFFLPLPNLFMKPLIEGAFFLPGAGEKHG